MSGSLWVGLIKGAILLIWRKKALKTAKLCSIFQQSEA